MHRLAAHARASIPQLHGRYAVPTDCNLLGRILSKTNSYIAATESDCPALCLCAARKEAGAQLSAAVVSGPDATLVVALRL